MLLLHELFRKANSPVNSFTFHSTDSEYKHGKVLYFVYDKQTNWFKCSYVLEDLKKRVSNLEGLEQFSAGIKDSSSGKVGYFFRKAKMGIAKSVLGLIFKDKSN